jgi:4-hydroxy-tetrahydrodipicolinate synthase
MILESHWSKSSGPDKNPEIGWSAFKLRRLFLSRQGKMEKLHGIVVPMITPFKGEDMSEIDHATLRTLTNFLIENGVNALMINGTSGEFLLQTLDERKAAVRTVVNAAAGRVPVISGISESSTIKAIDLGLDAEDAGANAVLATGPIYYRTTDEGLFKHFSSILDKVRLPLMIYNIPSWIGYNIPALLVKRLEERYPGRIYGVKFTTNDLELFLEYLRVLKGIVPVTIGSDALILSALQLGADGATVGVANVLPEETGRIYRLFVEKRYAEAIDAQNKIDGYVQTMGLGTFPAAVKEALRFLGMDCGWPRSPLLPLEESQAKEVRESLSWKKM